MRWDLGYKSGSQLLSFNILHIFIRKLQQARSCTTNTHSSYLCYHPFYDLTHKQINIHSPTPIIFSRYIMSAHVVPGTGTPGLHVVVAAASPQATSSILLMALAVGLFVFMYGFWEHVTVHSGPCGYAMAPTLGEGYMHTETVDECSSWTAAPCFD
jgi:hypothetical protein